MKKIGYILILSCMAAIQCLAQEKADLRFSTEGEFKIVQFTDTHYKWGKGASNAATECIAEVLDAEHPDLVVFTGDQVYSDSVASSLQALYAPVSDRNIPFVMVFGNHDAEFDRLHGEMYDMSRSFASSLLPDRDGVGSPDYYLTIQSSDSLRTSSVLYFFDTHSRTPIEGIGKYAWLRFDQIAWYRQVSDEFTASNNGKPLPSLSFFHIPLPEYSVAVNAEKVAMVGEYRENVCSPAINSGMFTAMKEQGDVMATFCGHDHDNDFAVMYHDILLAYGRYSGGKTVYNHLGNNGARVILLKEGERSFDTWIRLRGGEIKDKATYPDDFLNPVKKKKSKK